MRPGTKVPSRKQVSSPLLDEVYDEETIPVVKQIEGFNATLGLDGWSTRTNDPGIGGTLSTANQGLLVKTVDTRGYLHTSDYLAQLLKEELQRVETEWKVNITALVTDNAANMSGIRTLVKEPNEFFRSYGCQAHIMNLLAKDVYDSSKSVVNKMVAVSKHLRNHHAESTEMKQMKMPGSPLPCGTRWNKVTATLQNLMILGLTLLLVGAFL